MPVLEDCAEATCIYPAEIGKYKCGVPLAKEESHKSPQMFSLYTMGPNYPVDNL